MNKGSINTWDADLYDSKIGFVSERGKEVVNLLNPQPGERILDLGCGTGELTYEIARSGAIPLGIDLSPTMIEKARRKFPDLQFAVVNAETFRTTEQFDAVFSNAALHWMKGAAAVIKSVWLALRPGGRFIAEFGGKGNVNTIMQGITGVLAEHGISAAERNPWYFPSIGILYPFYQIIVHSNGGWLKLFGLLWGLTLIGAVAATPGSIEGMIYTTASLKEHLLGFPEVTLQMLAFSFLFVSWERKKNE